MDRVLMLLKSKTVWAGILAAVTIIAGTVQAGDPVTLMVLGKAFIAVLGAIGVKDAIAKSAAT